MERRIDMKDGVDLTVENGIITVSAGDETVERVLDHEDTEIRVDGDEIVVSTDSGRKDVAALLGTYASHIRNMMDGVTRGFEYRMQGFYSHFPMDMKVDGDTFVISNFIGERTAREVPIPEGVDVSIDGEDVSVTGPDKEKVGQTAANIEQACYKGDRDPRKFQDGIYITGSGVKADE